MKINKYILFAIASITLTSCNEWLDVEPSTEVDKGAMFKNEDGFADAMAGVYVNMTDDNLYGKNMTWYAVELMGGGATAMFGDNTSYMGFSFHPNAQYFNESMRNNFVDNVWNKQYNTIANVNSILSDIDANKGVFYGNDYEIFKGEALGLRAFLHFDLLRLFGEAGTVNPDAKAIPYVATLTSEVYPMLTVKQCANAILEDLKAAKELLKYDPMFTGAAASKYVCSAPTGDATYRVKYNIKDWHNRRFHFNYYAAVATMARVYMWMGDQQNALACAKEVIDAQAEKFPWVAPELISNVASTSEYVSRDRTFSTEQIFALNINNLPDRMDGIMIEGEKAFAGQYGNILGINTDCFDETTRAMDPRYAYLNTTYSYYGTEFKISTKYYKDNDYQNSYSPWSANRLPLIRMTEMYYIAAECEPNLDTAIGYLESVRQNRGLAAFPLTCSSKEDLQHEIEMEYRKEFIAEGQMFYYKKRRNETINSYSAYEMFSVEPSLYTMPIPDDENVYGGREKN
ncbi:MAG: RagB/SusD family nutrient uptake outer membrane protein [Prevotella sp.]